MLIEVGDVVRHTDGDIGVVLDKMEREPDDETLYAIHWMGDGLLHLMLYENLEVLNG